MFEGIKLPPVPSDEQMLSQETFIEGAKTHSLGNESALEAVEYLTVPISRITRLRNPRIMSLTFEEIQAVGCPGLDLAKEDAEPLLKERLKNVFGAVSKEKLSFLLSIHDLARSLKVGQINPVVVCREGADDPFFQLIAGERRVCASIYGSFAEIEAKIYNSTLSEEDWLRIMDDENNQREELTLLERVISRNERYILMKERLGKVSSSMLSSELKCSKASAALYKKLFDSDAYAEVLELIRIKKITALRKAVEYVSKSENKGAKKTELTSEPKKRLGLSKWGDAVDLIPYKALLRKTAHLIIDHDFQDKVSKIDNLKQDEVQDLFVHLMDSIGK